MKFLRFILFPIVPVYFVVTWFRNLMYDIGWKSSKSYDFPILCVGNLSTGGTGKTPMVEYLIRLLKDDLRLATLSRGYGRKTKGFVLGNPLSNAESLGDEPFQFYNKFSDGVLVAVDANRQEGIAQLIQNEPKPQLIVLDDAFQHRKVKAGFYVMLTTYANLYTKDFVLPSGNLREPKSGAKRANIIVVTKCPDDLTTAKKQAIVSEIKPLDYQNVFFSSISYSAILYSENKSLTLSELSDFKLITGIANATPLVDFLTEKNLDFEHIAFKDHHNFSLQEIERFSKYDCIVTTEKDYMRLKNESSLIGKLYYLPIKVEIDNAEKFNRLIKDFALY
ncbi:tetraacyldisaccharide 4'-kinase [Olleya sp. HaHaR_3_96]|uniref:tetraacyldisaccharide 4'-kinase n=1 Tax=Olleya sp. HaHaR_3_96 TaxID=2745560 RepID=UPI001C4F5E8F|nr:tetraacyldisaccharide 4'-kinase [Olleya sp. HaHaR_3_96]QXP61372.1 tetraacyldisaccharide 4'-kinase [Olleya sp. HaHaR_3_96]